MRSDRNSLEETIRRTLLLGGFLVLVVRIAISSEATTDFDLGWHLSAAEWILQHHQVPWTDPFAEFGRGRTWIAYSWLFEILLSGFYKTFGLAGIILFTGLLALAISTSILAMVRQISADPAWVIGLTALAVLAIAPLLRTPRPWLFSILFFVIEYRCLLSARMTGDSRKLLLLPVLFCLWANLHIQFVYGLLALGVFGAEQLLIGRMVLSGVKPMDRPLRAWFILLLCCLVTLATPYHVHLYQVILEYGSQGGAYDLIGELQAMGFRHFSDWCALGLALWAAYSLGRNGTLELFPILLYVASLYIGFHAQRDIWLLVILSTGIVAQGIGSPSPESHPLFTGRQILLSGLLALLSAVTVARRESLTNADLSKNLASKFPANAVQYVKAERLSGPLYNHFDWGGYLIWTLPQMPVGMDGRTNLHGIERIRRSLDTWSGKPGWDADAELVRSHLVLAPVNSPLCALLRLDRRFRLRYEDDVAAVFVKVGYAR